MKQSFTDAVYLAVAAIPPGKVSSYGDIARQAGYPNHARAVARVLSQLPDNSTLPWHRVVRSDGHTPLGERQRLKLRQEDVPFNNNTIKMRLCRWY